MGDAFGLTPDAWARLRALLDEALSLPPAARDGWLQALDEGRLQGLKQRLQALLAHAASSDPAATADRLLQTLPRIETDAFAPPVGSVGEQPGARVGPYRLLRELGSGGMGSVWLAERDDMLQRRRVALKLPHGAWKRAGLAERLMREREILATLEHPNIARLYDAGLGAEGQPWLALEYVDGERLDTYVQTRQLGVRPRLELFLQVARAVAHAHGQLVVHRDLKPANILVDAMGQVKLLDFGIAKLLQEGVAPDTELTLAGGRVLTPEYASPEQLTGRPVGTASDVYALGVVLFELLADRRPFKPARASRAALEEAVVQQDAPSVSGAAPEPRRRALRGDLDSIVHKALQRDPAARYATVAALADDVQRHLDARPVRAQPATAGYRAARFVRRHRVPVAMAAALLLLLLAGLAGTAWQAHEARLAQQRAEAVKGFVAGLFTDANPFDTTSREPTVEALLHSAEARLARQPDAAPEVRVELLEMIGRSYFGLSRFDRAAALYVQALAEGRRHLGETHVLTRRARLAALEVHRFQGRLAEMKKELAELMPLLRADSVDGQSDRLDLLLAGLMSGAHLAINEGRFDAARDHAAEAVALSERLHGPVHAQTADALLLQSTAAFFVGDAGATLQAAMRSREVILQLHGVDRPHAKVLEARLAYGRALGHVGRFAAARDELEAVIGQARALLGAEASMVGYVANDLARMALELGDDAAALRHAQTAVDNVARDAGDDSVPAAGARLQLGRAQLALHRGEDAGATFERAHLVIAAARGASAPLALDASAQHAAALAQQGRLDEAASIVLPRLPDYRMAPAGSRQRGLHVAGLVKRLQGELPAAAALQDEALAALPDLPVHRPRRNQARVERAKLWLAQGDAGAALQELDRVALPEGSAAQSLGEAARLLTHGQALLANGQSLAAAQPLVQAQALWQALAPHSAGAREAAHARHQAQVASASN